MNTILKDFKDKFVLLFVCLQDRGESYSFFPGADRDDEHGTTVYDFVKLQHINKYKSVEKSSLSSFTLTSRTRTSSSSGCLCVCCIYGSCAAVQGGVRIVCRASQHDHNTTHIYKVEVRPLTKNRGLLLTALLTKAFQPPFLFQNQTTLRENAFILYVLVCMCVCYGMTERERHTHTKKRICCYHHYRYVASSGEKEQTSNNT